MPELRKNACKTALRGYDRTLHKRYEPYLAHFRKVVGYQPSIAFPRRYHEKMLWRKLFDHSPDIARFCDKLATRDFIAAKSPSLKMPELLWSGESPDAIPDKVFAEKTVLKCSHGCDFNFFWMPGKSDKEDAKNRLREWMSSRYGESNHEWGYSVVRPRILAERLLESPDGSAILDINVRAASGTPIFCSVIAHNKTPRRALGYFDLEGRPLRFADSRIGTLHGSYASLPPDLDCGEAVKAAVRESTLLSEGIDYARFDFLSDGDSIYGGEVTVYPAAGLSQASPHASRGADTIVSDFWDIRKSWFLNNPQPGMLGLYAAALRCALS